MRFFRSMRIFIKRIPHCIKNLIIWLPVIWSDQPWDYSFMYIILRKKLFTMEKFWNNPDNYMVCEKEGKRTYKQVKTARILCDRIIADGYLTEELDRRRSYKRAEIRRKYDFQYLHNLMAKYSVRWWD